MAKQNKGNKVFGLVGRDIGYSFSVGYFKEKFQALGLSDYEYRNFDVPNIEGLITLTSTIPNLVGMNVTIPYKQEIIPHLIKLDDIASQIGAVNTIRISAEGWEGSNTDCYGFEKSLSPLLKPHHTKALILGTGGASKAIMYVLNQLGIAYTSVSRNPQNEQMITYEQIDKTVIEDYQILINCSPVGTYPDIEKSPNIPYEYLDNRHILYDLVYNPSETQFLKKGALQGATVRNGYQMLVFQAEKSWALWNA